MGTFCSIFEKLWITDYYNIKILSVIFVDSSYCRGVSVGSCGGWTEALSEPPMFLCFVCKLGSWTSYVYIQEFCSPDSGQNSFHTHTSNLSFCTKAFRLLKVPLSHSPPPSCFSLHSEKKWGFSGPEHCAVLTLWRPSVYCLLCAPTAPHTLPPLGFALLLPLPQSHVI